MTDKTSTSRNTLSNSEIDLGYLLGQLIDGKWIIAISTLAFAILGVAFAILSTPIYQADALVQVEQKSSGGFSAIMSESLGDMFASESSADAEIQLIKSRMILNGTVDKFNLTTVVTPDYFPIIGKGIARLTRNEQLIKVSRFELPESAFPDEQTYQIEVLDGEKGTYQLINDDNKVLLQGKVGQKIIDNGYELQVSAMSAESGSHFDISKRSSLEAIDWLKENLSAAEQGKQTGIIKLSFANENGQLAQDILNDIAQRYFLQNVERNSAEAGQSIQFLKEKLPQLKEKLVDSENKLNTYRKKRESVDLTMEAESTLKVMVNLDAQLNELTFKEAEISQKYTKDHPAYKALLDKRQTLLDQKAKINKRIENLPETQKEILSLQRDVEVNQQIYVQLLNKIEELSVVKAGTVGNVRIVDHAQSFSKPIEPKKGLITGASTIFGLLGGILCVFIRTALHRGVENPDEIEELGLSVYTSIPRSELQLSLTDKLTGKKRSANKELLLLAEINPADLAIEALRSLRTSLHFAMMEAKNNVLMISGPAPSIGKSFVSTNFAVVYARTGKKVLIIDADMRKGYLQRAFGLKWEDGLSDYLSGKISTDEVVKHTRIENLDIVTRGQIPPNPSELLMHGRLKDLLYWASQNYDLVIVDTPPVLAVTDASIVGALAGTTLMVTRFSKSTVKEIDIARNRFEQAGLEVKGVIFNAVERKASSYYSEYGYYNYDYKSDSNKHHA